MFSASLSIVFFLAGKDARFKVFPIALKFVIMPIVFAYWEAGVFVFDNPNKLFIFSVASSISIFFLFSTDPFPKLLNKALELRGSGAFAWSFPKTSEYGLSKS